MAWPSPTEFNEAVQSPQTAFSDDDLRRTQPVANPLGLISPYSGNFADVYQLPGRRRTVLGRQMFHARGAASAAALPGHQRSPATRAAAVPGGISAISPRAFASTVSGIPW